MIGRIVEIAGDGRHLSLDRGFLVVGDGERHIGRIPIDDIAGLICNSYALTYSNNVIVALVERGCPVVLCGPNQVPAGIVWPVESHHRQAGRLDDQLAATLPLKKRLWKEIVQSKLAMQAEALELCGKPNAPLRAMVRKVRAGDAGNAEGQGARAYWKLLLGNGFRRDVDASDINGLLNYGYAILRSMVARHLMATGLHPGLPLHHANDGNPMRLVDDLMEPFRPAVDAWVWRLVQRGQCEVNADTKRALGQLPTRNLVTDLGISPLTAVAQRLCFSVTSVLDGSCRSLDLPHRTQGVLRALWDEERGEEQQAAAPDSTDWSLTAAVRVSTDVADGNV